MKLHSRLRLVVFAVAALSALVTVTSSFGCFELKKPPCAFSCAEPPHRCPDTYTCGEDGLCYREGADPEKCLLIPPGDGGSD
jgi:hypothetical protein